MKKIITIASALALTGSMALAMDEAAMDEEMMEAPAPSVSVGGSAAIGIINEDDDSDTTEDFKLIREYKVTFDSSGTTDGGLLFGAGISIEDTHDDAPGNAVNGSKVYVGSSDGSWKLQFGGNDPGIDLAGGIGVADDHFGGEDNEDIALSGSFGDTSYRLTMADPGINVPAYGFNADADTEANNYKAVQDAMKANDDWSIGVKHSLGTISVGVGMDSEDGLAIGVSTDLSGVTTSLYWSKSEYKNIDLDPSNTTGATAATDDNALNVSEVADSIELGSRENTGLGVKASMSAGEGATFSVGYSTLKLEQSSNTAANIGYNGTATTKLIEVDFSYDLGGGATLSAGIDKKDAESITDPGDTETNASTLTTKDTTTLEAKISMSF